MSDRRDLTKGSIGKKLIRFAIPLIMIQLLQAIYNLVDMIIVGRYLGASGMSAVSIGGQVTQLVLAICNGLANGGSAYIAQLYGAKRRDEARSVVGTLLSFLLLLALAFTIGVIALREPLLRLLKTPE